MLREKNIKVVVNACIKNCRNLAGAAAKADVFAISAMPPFYYKPASLDDLVEFYLRIADVGIDCGLACPPVHNLTTDELNQVEHDLISTGLFELLEKRRL